MDWLHLSKNSTLRAQNRVHEEERGSGERAKTDPESTGAANDQTPGLYERTGCGRRSSDAERLSGLACSKRGRKPL